jgi:hypothetical protein
VVESLFLGYKPLVNFQSTDLHPLEAFVTSDLVNLSQVVLELVPRLFCESLRVVNVLFEFLKFPADSHHWWQIETLAKERVADSYNSVSQLFSFLEDNDIH